MASLCDLAACSRPRWQLRDSNGFVTKSKYCQKHTCDVMEETSRGIQLCPDAKRKKQDFCRYHFENLMCSYEGCEQKRDNVEEKRYRCYEHSVRCEENGCNEYVKFARSKYCEHHMPCIAGGCPEKQSPSMDSLYCQRHTCTIEECPDEAVKDCRCRKHKKCATPDCEKVCKTLPGQDSLADHCAAHFNTCQACGIEISPNFKFCRADRCKSPDCSNGCTRDSLYCTEHLCARAGCAKPEESGRLFCADHECLVDGCDRERTTEGLFCAGKHACNWGKCLERRIESYGSIHTEWCLEHDRAIAKREGWQEGCNKAQPHIEDARTQLAAAHKQNAELQALVEELRREARQRKEDEERIRETRKPHRSKSRTMPASPTLSSSDEGYRSDDREPTTWGPGFQFTPRPDSGRNRHSGFYTRYE